MLGERVKALLSDEHFSVDGTLIDVWASIKSFRPKDGGDDDTPPGGGRNAERDFRSQKRSNETHASTPDARLYRKGNGQSSRLRSMGDLLMENCSALIIDAEAAGTAEREAALVMLARRNKRHRITLGADKAYDVASFVDRDRPLRVIHLDVSDPKISILEAEDSHCDSGPAYRPTHSRLLRRSCSSMVCHLEGWRALPFLECCFHRDSANARLVERNGQSNV